MKELKGFYNYEGEFISKRSFNLIRLVLIYSILLILSVFICSILNIKTELLAYIYTILYGVDIVIAIIGISLMLKDKNK